MDDAPRAQQAQRELLQADGREKRQPVEGCPGRCSVDLRAGKGHGVGKFRFPHSKLHQARWFA